MSIDFERDSYIDDTEDLLRKLRGDLQKAARAALKAQEQSLGNDEKMADAFNRVATALETLTEEIRGLRADLAPTLDKPRRLQAPGGQ